MHVHQGHRIGLENRVEGVALSHRSREGRVGLAGGNGANVVRVGAVTVRPLPAEEGVASLMLGRGAVVLCLACVGVDPRGAVLDALPLGLLVVGGGGEGRDAGSIVRIRDAEALQPVRIEGGGALDGHVAGSGHRDKAGHVIRSVAVGIDVEVDGAVAVLVHGVVPARVIVLRLDGVAGDVARIGGIAAVTHALRGVGPAHAALGGVARPEFHIVLHGRPGTRQDHVGVGHGKRGHHAAGRIGPAGEGVVGERGRGLDGIGRPVLHVIGDSGRGGHGTRRHGAAVLVGDLVGIARKVKLEHQVIRTVTVDCHGTVAHMAGLVGIIGEAGVGAGGDRELALDGAEARGVDLHVVVLLHGHASRVGTHLRAGGRGAAVTVAPGAVEVLEVALDREIGLAELAEVGSVGTGHHDAVLEIGVQGAVGGDPAGVRRSDVHRVPVPVIVRPVHELVLGAVVIGLGAVREVGRGLAVLAADRHRHTVRAVGLIGDGDRVLAPVRSERDQRDLAAGKYAISRVGGEGAVGVGDLGLRAALGGVLPAAEGMAGPHGDGGGQQARLGPLDVGHGVVWGVVDRGLSRGRRAAQVVFHPIVVVLLVVDPHDNGAVGKHGHIGHIVGTGGVGHLVEGVAGDSAGRVVAVLGILRVVVGVHLGIGGHARLCGRILGAGGTLEPILHRVGAIGGPLGIERGTVRLRGSLIEQGNRLVLGGGRNGHARTRGGLILPAHERLVRMGGVAVLGGQAIKAVQTALLPRDVILVCVVGGIELVHIVQEVLGLLPMRVESHVIGGLAVVGQDVVGLGARAGLAEGGIGALALVVVEPAEEGVAGPLGLDAGQQGRLVPLYRFGSE